MRTGAPNIGLRREKRNLSIREMESDIPPLPACNGDDTHFTIRGNPNYRAHARVAYRRLRADDARATSARFSARIAADTRGISIAASRRVHGMFADRSKGRMPEAGRHGAVHDIAKKSVQLPIVHCRASE
jgi:hypothetical protein